MEKIEKMFHHSSSACIEWITRPNGPNPRDSVSYAELPEKARKAIPELLHLDPTATFSESANNSSLFSNIARRSGRCEPQSTPGRPPEPPQAQAQGAAIWSWPAVETLPTPGPPPRQYQSPIIPAPMLNPWTGTLYLSESSHSYPTFHQHASSVVSWDDRLGVGALGGAPEVGSKRSFGTFESSGPCSHCLLSKPKRGFLRKGLTEEGLYGTALRCLEESHNRCEDLTSQRHEQMKTTVLYATAKRGPSLRQRGSLLYAGRRIKNGFTRKSAKRRRRSRLKLIGKRLTPIGTRPNAQERRVTSRFQFLLTVPVGHCTRCRWHRVHKGGGEWPLM